jgi:pimeloyl-ACP methyl ester carboxylesterase
VLRARLPAAEVVALDLPGNGRLYRSKSPSHIEEMVECERSQLSALGFAPPYYLLGLSMGAMVAAAWSTLYAQELKGCVLINSSLRGIDPFYRRMRPSAYPALLPLIAGDVVRQERALLRLTSRSSDAQTDVLEKWVAYQRECPVSRANALRQLIAAARYRPRNMPPAVPLLILSSARDALVNPCCSRHLAKKWDAPLAIHPDAGHDLPLDDPDWVARRVRDWIAACA